MIQLRWAFIGLLLLGCGTQKEITPEWVLQKPIEQGFIYGVGSAYVNPNTDYQRIARQNALGDLASELRASIQSNTSFQQKEDRYGYSSEFNSSTQIQNNLELVGYEQVASFTNSNEQYYVLYRMDRSKYQQFMQDKRTSIVATISAELNGYDQLGRSAQLKKIMHWAALAEKWGALNEPMKNGTVLGNFLLSMMDQWSAQIQPQLLEAESTAYAGVPESINLWCNGLSGLEWKLASPTATCVLEYHNAKKLARIMFLRTGKESNVNISLALDTDAYLAPGAGLPKLFSHIAWPEVHTTFKLHQPTVYCDVSWENKAWKNFIEETVNVHFALAKTKDEAQFILKVSGEVRSDYNGNKTFNGHFAPRFSFTRVGSETSQWAQSAEYSALSRSKEGAMRTVQQDAQEEFELLFLPQIYRQLAW